MLQQLYKNRISYWVKDVLNLLYIKMKYGDKVKFKDTSCKVCRNAVFEGANKIESHSGFSGSFMGYGTYIGHHSNIGGSIGRFCCIAPYVRYNPGRHPFTPPTYR